MSQQPNAYGNPEVQLYQEPERTSILAILSLVFGALGCCGGVTSILGIPMAVFAIFGISRSKGRVGGMGLAIGGLVVGLLTLALWIGLIIGGGGAWYSTMKGVGDNIETVLIESQNGNYDAVRAVMDSPAADVSDEELMAFQAAYQSDLGNYVSRFQSIGELFSGYFAVGEQINNYNTSKGDLIPVPMRFDSGWVLVIYHLDPSGMGSTGTNGMPLPKQLILVGSDGTEYSIPMGTGTGALPSAGAGSDADSDAESPTPDADNAEEEVIEDPEEGP